jgi:hypothetical protein
VPSFQGLRSVGAGVLGREHGMLPSRTATEQQRAHSREAGHVGPLVGDRDGLHLVLSTHLQERRMTGRQGRPEHDVRAKPTTMRRAGLALLCCESR